MSIKLPVDQRRTCISAVELLASNYGCMAENCKTSRPNTNTKAVTKSEATKTIEWFTGLFKKKLDRYLKPEEENRIIVKIDLITSQVISQLDENLAELHLYDKISGIFKEIFKQVLFENPLVTQQPDHSLSRQDFQVAEQPNYDEYASNKRVTYCHDFAFYQLNEEKAFPYIFNSAGSMWGNEFVEDSINYVSKWGYDQVELGITFVVKHPVGDVALGYGDDVYFFHKKIKSTFLNNFVNELDNVYRSISNYSHPAVASPLTTRGSVRKIIKIFKTMPLTKVFNSSTYNVDYNNELREKIILKLKEYYITTSDLVQKSEAIEAIKQMTLQISEQIERKI